MKKLLTVILLSLSAAAMAGCTDTNQPTAISQTPESGIESSVLQESKEEKSKAEESEKENSKEEESENTDSKEGNSKEEKSEDTESKEEKSGEEESEDTESKEEKSGEEESEDTDSKAEDSEKENSDEESKKEDDIFSFKIRLNDIDYQLPFDYDELAQLGYYFDRDGELEPKKYTLGVNPKNEEGDSIKAQLWNPTDKVQNYSDCKIGSVEIKLGDEIDVVLPGEFVFDESVTPEAVKEQYGEPESEHISEKYVTLRYKKDLLRTVEFFIYTDESMIDYTSVTVKNFS